jgi:hypothetical protein
VICYAAAGESVWDVARRYAADPRRIMEDNRIDDDLLTQDTVLVIPGA